MFNIDPDFERLKISFMNLNSFRNLVFNDAVNHGLWTGQETMGEIVGLIRDEVRELECATDRENFTEELADVIIMSLSVAGHLGIDIDAAVREKIKINEGRPWRHEEVNK